jgi:hypothetical protein
MELIKVETKEQLKALNDCSAMTWEGLIEEDLGVQLATKDASQDIDLPDEELDLD